MQPAGSQLHLVQSVVQPHSNVCGGVTNATIGSGGGFNPRATRPVAVAAPVPEKEQNPDMLGASIMGQIKYGPSASYRTSTGNDAALF